ncbi:hypothetical protein [Sediminimonas sp.]|jgi:hypothetical protein|nr:hypothetical protein [Sediminimonas sp.]
MTTLRITRAAPAMTLADYTAAFLSGLRMGVVRTLDRLADR